MRFKPQSIFGRRFRHDADDSCPIGADGRRQHACDYREGGCRQARNAELSANLGWAMPGTGSAMAMRRGQVLARGERLRLHVAPVAGN